MAISQKQERLAKFWRKFLRLTRGRVTALRALSLAAEEERDPAFRQIVKGIHDAVEQGTSFSDALRQHPGEFSPSITELVKTAEKTGAWDEILGEISDGLQDGTFE